MAGLISSSGKGRVDISPDKTSLIFQSVEKGHQVWFPAKDWNDMKDFIDSKLNKTENTKENHG